MPRSLLVYVHRSSVNRGHGSSNFSAKALYRQPRTRG